MSLTRAALAEAFPKNPRLRAEFEKLADTLDAATGNVDSLTQSATDADSRISLLEGNGVQPQADILDAISSLADDDLGVIQKVGIGEVVPRQVDSDDDSCLVSRPFVMSYAGMGPTANRPTLSALRRAIYFDTTLATHGKPVFWTGTQWVDSSGSLA